eukprot:10049899-Lingulodinium_polyedra.AAC.1
MRVASSQTRWGRPAPSSAAASIARGTTTSSTTTSRGTSTRKAACSARGAIWLTAARASTRVTASAPR